MSNNTQRLKANKPKRISPGQISNLVTLTANAANQADFSSINNNHAFEQALNSSVAITGTTT